MLHFRDSAQLNPSHGVLPPPAGARAAKAAREEQLASMAAAEMDAAVREVAQRGIAAQVGGNICKRRAWHCLCRTVGWLPQPYVGPTYGCRAHKLGCCKRS